MKRAILIVATMSACIGCDKPCGCGPKAAPSGPSVTPSPFEPRRFDPRYIDPNEPRIVPYTPGSPFEPRRFDSLRWGRP